MWPQIPAEVDPAAYYILVGLAVVITGIAKAGFGGGIGILAVPLMAAAMPDRIHHMLGIMLPTLIAADILSNLHYLKQYEWRLLKPLLVGATLGIASGTVAVWKLQQAVEFQNWLRLLVGGICLLFVVVEFYRLGGGRIRMLPPHPGTSVGVGTLAGFVSTLAHSAGPIAALYLLQEKVEKRKLVGTLLLFFLIVNVSKVPTYVFIIKWINLQTLRDSIWFIPLLPVGTLLGAWMHNRIPEKAFAATMYTIAAATAGYMIYRSL